MALILVHDNTATGSKTSEMELTSRQDDDGVSFMKLITEDLLVNILCRLEDDPRDLSRLACVCQTFLKVIRNVCWKRQCTRIVPELMPSPKAHLDQVSEPSGGWGALMKVLICCPGLKCSGVRVNFCDFGHDREREWCDLFNTEPRESIRRKAGVDSYRCSSKQSTMGLPNECVRGSSAFQGMVGRKRKEKQLTTCEDSARKLHLAAADWNLSREQGSKLLASRFRCDSLYVCDWPGCIHAGKKRNYKLFRGFFTNFKSSLLWRTLIDMNAKPSQIHCAFCSSPSTWDMMTAFCLRRSFEYLHGEPIVHGRVCENGHVSGAWTVRPCFVPYAR